MKRAIELLNQEIKNLKYQKDNPPNVRMDSQLESIFEKADLQLNKEISELEEAVEYLMKIN